MPANPLYMILPAKIPGRGRFYVAFRAMDDEQLVRINSLADPLIITGPSDLDAGQAMSCGPIRINNQSFPVLHIRTAEEID